MGLYILVGDFTGHGLASSIGFGARFAGIQYVGGAQSGGGCNGP